MPRSVDVRVSAPQSEGFNQATLARTSHVPSLADGCAPNAVSDPGGVAAGSPGAVLGTGQNPDRYTPVLEAV